MGARGEGIPQYRVEGEGDPTVQDGDQKGDLHSTKWGFRGIRGPTVHNGGQGEGDPTVQSGCQEMGRRGGNGLLFPELGQSRPLTRHPVPCTWIVGYWPLTNCPSVSLPLPALLAVGPQLL